MIKSNDYQDRVKSQRLKRDTPVRSSSMSSPSPLFRPSSDRLLDSNECSVSLIPSGVVSTLCAVSLLVQPFLRLISSQLMKEEAGVEGLMERSNWVEGQLGSSPTLPGREAQSWPVTPLMSIRRNDIKMLLLGAGELFSFAVRRFRFRRKGANFRRRDWKVKVGRVLYSRWD